MPYPPPPAPPTVGFFQGIGRLIAPTLPDVTGHGGEFLETDGVIPQWEPVSGALPPQTGHAGEFLTTDGVNASWATVAGGGIIAIGALTTPTADAAIISGGNTLQLAPADQTHPGVMATTQQDVGGLKLFHDGATSYVFDIRNYGAVSATSATDLTTGTVDCSPAIEAAIAAWTQHQTNVNVNSIFPLGGIYFPSGNWYISRPIVPPAAAVLFGDGPNLSNIIAGGGTPSTPSLVQGFGGSVIAPTGINFASTINTGTGLPNYNAPLVGVTGRSLDIRPYDSAGDPTFFPPTIILDDCFPWSGFLTWCASALTLRFWVDVSVMPPIQSRQNIIGSNGLEGIGAIAVQAETDGGGANLLFRAYLTTAATGQANILSGNFSLGTHYIELDYDGAHFWFYVDGVYQGQQAMTGRVDKKAWESVTIGEADAVFGGRDLSVITGSIDSIELANTARHTGTGSYTPPTSKHVADSATLWLANFDQGEPPHQTQASQWPFLIAQTVITDGTGIGPTSTTAASVPPNISAGLVPHWCRLGGWANSKMNYAGPSYAQINGLGIVCSGNSSGIVCYSSPFSTFQNFIIVNAAGLGFNISDANSFYSQAFNFNVSNAQGVGVLFASAEIDHVKTVGCGIGIWLVYGLSNNISDQPAWNSFIPFIYGPTFSSIQAIHAIGHTNDEETLPYFQKCAAYVSLTAPAVFESCAWDTGLTQFGTPVPPVLVATVGEDIKMVGCNFYPPSSINAITATPTAGITASIMLENCLLPFSTLPPSDVPGLVSQMSPRHISNQTGISTTSTLSNNLAGTFSVLHGYTEGGPIFPIPEPDGRYEVAITCKGYNGSAPAAGSTNVVSYTTRTDGFTATVGADPGGTCQVDFSYHIIRTPGAPLYYAYTPSPGSITNPLVAASPTGPWCVGVTLVPASGNSFGCSALGLESVCGAGTPGAADSWELTLTDGVMSSANFGATAVPFDSFTDGGRLYGLMSPGPHNIVFGNVSNVFGRHINGWFGHSPVSAVFVDGGFKLIRFAPSAFPTGTQQTPLWIGERSGATNVLTAATLRNFKVDTDTAQVITYEPDAGPQAGDLESAILGDGWAMGLSESTGPSWATQIISARYGTTYYWMGVQQSATLITTMAGDFWPLWGALQSSLQSICVAAGLVDIVGGATSADMMASFTAIMEGGPASATVLPPTFNQQSFCLPYTNLVTWSAPGAVIINGVTFNVTFNTDQDTTMSDLANAINASSPTNTYVTATAHPHTSIQAAYVELDGLAPGFQSNSVVVTSTGVFQIYPGQGNMVNGANAIVTINGTDFDFPFLTDAATTVNTVISLINADAPTAALVTPSNVANQLVLTAVTSGAAGNSITLTTNNFGGAGVTGAAREAGTLVGGYDGAIQVGIPNIVVTTVPPFGDYISWTSGKETQRTTYNAAVAAYATAHAADGVVLADIDATIRDPGDHTKVDPTFLASPGSLYVNDAGQTALFGLLSPLLP